MIQPDKHVGFERTITDSGREYPVKGYRGHNFANPYGPTEGDRKATYDVTNPSNNNMFWSQQEERENAANAMHDLSHGQPILRYRENQSPYASQAYTANPNSVQIQRGEYAQLVNRREGFPGDAHIRKPRSCWKQLIDCLFYRGGSNKQRGGANVTIQELRSFLDTHQDIKFMLKNDTCPLNKSESLRQNAEMFMNMLKQSGNPNITIEEIYTSVQEAGKRKRKRTRKSVRKTVRKSVYKRTKRRQMSK